MDQRMKSSPFRQQHEDRPRTPGHPVVNGGWPGPPTLPSLYHTMRDTEQRAARNPQRGLLPRPIPQRCLATFGGGPVFDSPLPAHFFRNPMGVPPQGYVAPPHHSGPPPRLPSRPGVFPHFRPIFHLRNPKHQILSQDDLKIFVSMWGRCVVVCWCSFTLDGSHDQIFKVSSEARTHAEERALSIVERREIELGRKARNVVIISSYSPCRQCANQIVKFVRSRGCTLDLWFTKLYKHTVKEHFEGLQILSHEVKMSVSNTDMWTYLIQSTDFCICPPYADVLVPSAIGLSAWDRIWSEQLEAILQRDYENILSKEKLSNKWSNMVSSNNYSYLTFRAFPHIKKL